MYMAWLEHLWKTGDNWKESVLSFHHEGPKNQIHAVLLGGIHFTGLKFSFDNTDKSLKLCFNEIIIT